MSMSQAERDAQDAQTVTDEAAAAAAQLLVDITTLQRELLILHDNCVARNYSQKQDIALGGSGPIVDNDTKMLEWLDWAQEVREANDSGSPAEQLAALEILESSTPT